MVRTTDHIMDFACLSVDQRPCKTLEKLILGTSAVGFQQGTKEGLSGDSSPNDMDMGRALFVCAILVRTHTKSRVQIGTAVSF